MTLITIIYLVGVVVAYVVMKRICKKHISTWTKGDRAHAILISLGSIVTVLTIAFISTLDLFNNNKPAKW